MLVKTLTSVLAIGLVTLTLFAAAYPAHAANRHSPRWQVTEQVAQACLSRRQIRAAVRSGLAIPLSQLIAVIRATVAGQVLPQPQLCNAGGRLVYLINILNGSGQVQQLTIDAGSGNILGY